MLKYRNTTPSLEAVEKFLYETKDEFNVPLDQLADIKLYALKLHEYSEFSLCYDDEIMIGMISCYMNHSPEGYISNVCVKKKYQQMGIFKNLFNGLISIAKKKGINRITLEVNNENIIAFNAYIKTGFLLQKILEKSSYLYFNLPQYACNLLTKERKMLVLSI
jgi:ribosomal protein S18 acetylase RimI-like enzyme